MRSTTIRPKKAIPLTSNKIKPIRASFAVGGKVSASPLARLGTSIINAFAQQFEARVDVLSGAEGTTMSVTRATFAKLHWQAADRGPYAAINSRACPTAAFFREMSNFAQTQPSHGNLLPEGRLLLRSRRHIDSPRHWWKPTIKSSSSGSTASSQGVQYGYPDTSDHYRHCAAARRRRLVWPRTLVLGPVYIHLVPRTVATRLMMAANP